MKTDKEMAHEYFIKLVEADRTAEVADAWHYIDAMNYQAGLREQTESRPVEVVEVEVIQNLTDALDFLKCEQASKAYERIYSALGLLKGTGS